MFSMITGQAAEECVQLDRWASELQAGIVELERTVQELKTLSCMEECVGNLNRQLERMQKEYRLLRQMGNGLENITLNYISCEKRICANAEQGVVWHVRREVSRNDLSWISGLMEGIEWG